MAIAALLLAFHFAPWRGSIAPTSLPPQLADEPDLHLEQATITQFDADGRIAYRLRVREAGRFEATQFTRLIEPDFEFHNGTESPWRISSDHGEIHGNAVSERVLLRQSVVIRHESLGGHGLTIIAHSLDIYPHRKYAETEGDVMIDSDMGRTTARGMRADFASGSMQLSSQADAPIHTIIQGQSS